jgi:Family of unknown function (DUF5681)
MVKPRKHYEVGYARPPRSGQFTKGQSGNPKGRRKGAKLFVEIVMEALNEKVSINENGSRKMITKREALAKQVANKGATGDLKSIKLLFEILEGLDDRERITRSEAAHHQNSTARERFKAKLDQLRERMDAQQKLLKKD